MYDISVIIPIFNKEAYLRECLESVIQQEGINTEIICINDGSSDGSLEILKSYRDLYKCISIYDQANSGAAYTRNKGIRIAKGEFLFFIDADDTLADKNSLHKLFCYAKENNLLICGGSLQLVNDNMESLPLNHSQSGYVFADNRIMKYSDYQYDLGYTRFIYSRKMIVDNDILFPDLATFEDPVFLVKALYCADMFGTISDYVYNYRYVSDGLSRRMTKNHILDFIKGIKMNIQFSEMNHLDKLYKITVHRINTEFRSEIEYALNELDDDQSIFKELMKTNSIINWTRTDEKSSMLTPIEMVYSEYKKYEQLRKLRIAGIVRKVIGSRR